MVDKYIKRDRVEAIQWNGSNTSEVEGWLDTYLWERLSEDVPKKEILEIANGGRPLIVNVGNWIIRDDARRLSIRSDYAFRLQYLASNVD